MRTVSDAEFALALQVLQQFIHDMQDGKRRIQDYGVIEWVELEPRDEERILNALATVAQYGMIAGARLQRLTED